MSRRARIDVVAIADREYNSTLNDPASAMSDANKATEETALSDASLNITARVIFSVGGYTKIKWRWNGKPLATFKSRDYVRAEALAFLEEVKDMYDVYSTLGVNEIDTFELSIADATLEPEATSQLSADVVQIDLDEEDVIAECEFSVANTPEDPEAPVVVTVSSSGLVTAVADGTAVITARYRNVSDTVSVTVATA